MYLLYIERLKSGLILNQFGTSEPVRKWEIQEEEKFESDYGRNLLW